MRAPKVNWRKHDAAIVGTVRSLTEFYLGSYPNRATPGQFLPVIEWLAKVTAPIEKKRKLYLEDIVSGLPQWARDFDKWKERLSAYKAVTAQAISIDPDDRTAADFTRKVTAPLLLGWYPDPGQLVQKPPDVVTPLTIGFMEKIGAGDRRHNWDALWADLGKRTRATGYGAIAVAAVAGVTALYISKGNED
jgi:hypothetical protein